MRSNSKSLLRALVVVLAFGALTATSASAFNFPEFRTSGAFPVTFTGSGSAIFHESGGASFECRTGSIRGEIINSKEVANVKLTFGNGMYCPSEFFCAGLENKWETSNLKGRIAYLVKSTRTVGLLLEPVTQPFAPCRGFNEITGSIIAEVTPVNRSVTAYTLKYESTEAGHETWQHFEGEELIHNLTIHILGGEARQLGLTDAPHLTMSKAVEIAA